MKQHLAKTHIDTQGNTGIVYGFTGNYSRKVADGRSYTANATFTGVGTIVTPD